MVDFYIAMDFSEMRLLLVHTITIHKNAVANRSATSVRKVRRARAGNVPCSNASGNSEEGKKALRIGDRCYRPANSLLKALPMTILLISLVPAPIS